MLAIIVIMTGVILGNGNKNKAAFDVEATARQVAAQLRIMQGEALNGKSIGGVVACKYNFNALNSAYVVGYNNCTTDAVIASGTQIVDLASKRISFGAIPISFYFTSPLGKPSAPQSIAVTSTIPSGGIMYICVSSEGSISEQKTVCL